MKRCSRCGQPKPLSEFRKNRRAKDGLAYWCRACERVYRQANRERHRAYFAEYYTEHAEQLRQRTRDWNTQNVQHKAETGAIYRRTNREKLRAWHREYRKGSAARRAAEAIKTNVRRAQKKGTCTVPFTAEELEAKFAYWNDCCWVCGDPATTIDHVKPLSRGGAHMLCNLRPACEGCNFSRHNAWPLPSRAVILGVA